MRNRILVLTVLALLVFTSAAEFRKVRTITLRSGSDYQETEPDLSLNIVAADDTSPDLTL